MKEAFAWFSDMVEPTGYVGGTSHVTVADLTFLGTYSSVKAIVKDTLIQLSDYPVLEMWYERVKAQVPNYAKACQEGTDSLASWMPKD
jgi:glutathione S-transferase